MKIQKFLGHI